MTQGWTMRNLPHRCPPRFRPCQELAPTWSRRNWRPCTSISLPFPLLGHLRTVLTGEPVVCQNPVTRLDDTPAACEPGGAMSLVIALLGALRASLKTRTDLALENLA